MIVNAAGKECARLRELPGLLDDEYDLIQLDQYEHPFVTRHAEAIRTFDGPVILDGGGWKDWSPEFLGLADIPIVSEGFFAGGPDAFAAECTALGIERWAMTRGARGVIWHEHGRRRRDPGAAGDGRRHARRRRHLSWRVLPRVHGVRGVRCRTRACQPGRRTLLRLARHAEQHAWLRPPRPPVPTKGKPPQRKPACGVHETLYPVRSVVRGAVDELRPEGPVDRRSAGVQPPGHPVGDAGARALFAQGDQRGHGP